MGHLAGGKITRSHTTAIEEAADVVRALQKHSDVSKIVLGAIKAGLPNGQPRVKSIPITGGIRVEVRGIHSKQQLFVYTAEPEAVAGLVNGLFG
jgi:hypothetical protein